MAISPADTDRPAPAAVETPRGFYSYSHENWESSVRLVEELKLRGFHVFRDIEKMGEGRRLDDEMGRGIDEADLLMCLLTEQSLNSEPVVEKELKPALRKSARGERPVVMPVVCGLGGTHQEVTERTWPVLQHDFEATWTGGILNDATDPLSLDDAAAMAARAIRAVYPADSGPGEGAWQLQVVTRGTPSACDGLSVDATSFLGGEHPQVGHPAAWERVHRGLLDLEQTLRGCGRRRRVELTGQAHLTAAVATGFVFRRPTGWRLSVRADDGELQEPAGAGSDESLNVSPQPGKTGSDFITAEVNLLGKVMDPLVDQVLASLGRPALRLRIEHTRDGGRIPYGELPPLASAIASLIKAHAAQQRAETVHLFLAAPFALGVLLGAELNAAGGFLQLYERADHAYHPSLELEST